MILIRSNLSQVVMASKASRLLKSVRLMLAREKSYDVSQAEEGKRGRKAGRTAYQHRFVQKQTPPTHIDRFRQIKAWRIKHKFTQTQTQPTNTCSYTVITVNKCSERIRTKVVKTASRIT